MMGSMLNARLETFPGKTQKDGERGGREKRMEAKAEVSEEVGGDGLFLFLGETWTR